jgi:hypothetical protein
MKFRIFIFALLFVSGSAFAEWRLIAESAKGDMVYIDPATVRKDGNMRTYWRKIEYKIRGKYGDISSRAKFEIDCKKEAIRMMSLASFSDPNLSGEVISKQDFPNDGFSAIAPETINNVFMQLVCI